MIKRKIGILINLILRRNSLGYKSLYDLLAFYTQINPIFNFLFFIIFVKFKNNPLIIIIINKLLFHGIGFGALRNMSPENRIEFNNKINKKDIKFKYKDYENIQLVDKGFVKLRYKIDKEKVNIVKDFFSRTPYYSSQVFTQSNGKEIYKDWRDLSQDFKLYKRRNFCFNPIDSLNFLIKNQIIDLEKLHLIANNYCGFNTQLYGFNTFGTFPGYSEDYVMRMHRDFDDFSSLTFFISWTATSENDGATLFLPYTHRISNSTNKITYLSSKPGEIYVLDTFGLHAGNINSKKPRLTSWIRFGRRKNLATIQDGIECLINF